MQKDEEKSTELGKSVGEKSQLLKHGPSTTSSGSETRSGDKPMRQSVRRKWRKKLLYIAAYSRLLEREAENAQGWQRGSRSLLMGSKLNILLVFLVLIPFAISSKVWTFTFTCLALLPLAALLGDVTEKVAYHTSETIGGLLNATFGNATEALVSIFALRKGLLTVVQVSLLGSVLSNMLLVLGSAFVAAGLRNKLVRFNRHAATANTGLLLIAVLALLIPAMLTADSEITPKGREQLSRLTAVLMLIIYVVYIHFQLSSHSTLFDEEDTDHHHQQQQQQQQQQNSKPMNFADIALVALDTGRRSQYNDIEEAKSPRQQSSACAPRPKSPKHSEFTASLQHFSRHPLDEHEYVLKLDVALIFLAIITVIVAILSELLTDSLEGFALSLKIPDSFVGFVLLPLVGNAAEHATAISMAYRSKIDLAVAVALGSGTQIALFVLPAMVLIGWIIHQPLDLAFGSFQTAITALSVLIVNSIAQQGEIHYLNGLCLVIAYVIIAASFLYLTETIPST